MFLWLLKTASSSAMESETAVEVGAEVGHATLGAVYIGQGFLETERAEHRAQGLAGLGRIDGQGLMLEVECLAFLGIAARSIVTFRKVHTTDPINNQTVNVGSAVRTGWIVAI